MLRRSLNRLLLLVLGITTTSIALAASGSDPLPSWNDGNSKQAIVTFVEKVTTPGSADFVEPADRIATFDNDGTLWAEQPAYFQLLFAIERVQALAANNPGWKTRQPFKAVLDGDMKTLAASGDRGILQLVMATHSGMTTEEFEADVKQWISTAKHPKSGRLYTEMVYQPMLELLAYLRANGFKTFIVSGGGIEFMRPWVQATYGIPPEQVIGSSIVTKFQMQNGVPVLMRQPKINFIDDKEGKPVAINRYIGKRPIAAFGNSDGDLQMLQWTMAGDGARLALYVHYTDDKREWAYDRKSHFGKLDKGLDEARARGWVLVDMKNEWKTIFPGQ